MSKEIDTAYALLLDAVRKTVIGIESLDQGELIRVPNSLILERALTDLQAAGSAYEARPILEKLVSTLQIAVRRLLMERSEWLMQFDAQERTRDLDTIIACQLSFSSAQPRDLSLIRTAWESQSATLSTGLLANQEHLSAVLFAEVLCRQLVAALKMVPA